MAKNYFFLGLNVVGTNNIFAKNMVPEKPVPFEEYIPMLLVVFLTVKSYICVQKYDNSKMTYFC